MRIDLCLSRLCLFKTRSQAGRACDEGRVWLNDKPARSSREVHAGDRIRFTDPLGRWVEEVEVMDLPQGQVSRAAARDLVRVLSRKSLDEEPDGSEDSPA